MRQLSLLLGAVVVAGVAGCSAGSSTTASSGPESTTGSSGREPAPPPAKDEKVRVKLVDLAAGKEPTVLELPAPAPLDAERIKNEESKIERGPYAVAISGDGKTIAVAGKDGAVTFEGVDGKGMTGVPGIFPLALAPKGTMLAAGLSNAGGLCLALSPDGGVLAIGRDGIRLFETASGKEVAHLKDVHNETVQAVAFSVDGKQLVSAAGPQLATWDVSSHKPLANVRIPDYESNNGSISLSLTMRVVVVSFTPDGKTVLAGNLGYPLVATWEPALGKNPSMQCYTVLQTIPGGISSETTSFTALAFAPDGKTMVAIHQAGDLKVWEVGTANVLAKLPEGGKGIAKGPQALAVSPDGKVVVAAGVDGKAKRWEMAKLLVK